jgi:hypothetical protein
VFKFACGGAVFEDWVGMVGKGHLGYTYFDGLFYHFFHGVG